MLAFSVTYVSNGWSLPHTTASLLSVPPTSSSPRQRRFALTSFIFIIFHLCDFTDPGRYSIAHIRHFPVWFSFHSRMRVSVMSEDEDLFPITSFYGSGRKELSCSICSMRQKMKSTRESFWFEIQVNTGLPWWLRGKESVCNAGGPGLISGSDALEKGMANHSSILTWRIPWTEETEAIVLRVPNCWVWLSTHALVNTMNSKVQLKKKNFNVTKCANSVQYAICSCCI